MARISSGAVTTLLPGGVTGLRAAGEVTDIGGAGREGNTGGASCAASAVPTTTPLLTPLLLEGGIVYTLQLGLRSPNPAPLCVGGG